VGILLRLSGPMLVLAVLGCSQARFTLRVEEPSGARLEVAPGAFEAGGELPIPFEATFAPMGDWQAYQVRLTLPPAVAARYGGRQAELTLYGKLYVHPATDIARGSVVRLPIGEERLHSLVEGRVSEINAYVYDPNAFEQQTLARIVLRAQPF
jgi:hypothetical protein